MQFQVVIRDWADPGARWVGLVLLFFLVSSGFSQPSQAGGFTVSVLGGRRGAAFANLATPDDTTALFHNPAGLADQKGWRTSLFGAFFWVETDFKMKALDPRLFPEINESGCEQTGDCDWPIDRDGYYTESVQPEQQFGAMPYLGISKDLGFLGDGWDDVVTSMALYFPASYGGKLPAQAPTRYQIIDGYFVAGSLTAGFGWRINKYIAIGANVSYMHMRIHTTRDISVVASLAEADENGDWQPTIFGEYGQEKLGDMHFRYTGKDNGASWGASVLLSPVSWLNIGLNYIGYTPARFEGKVQVSSQKSDFDTVFGPLGIKKPIGLTVEMPIPHSIQGGIAILCNQTIEIGFDVRTWLYQVYKEQKVIPIYDPRVEGTESFTEEMLSTDKKYNMSYELAAGVLLRPLTQHQNIEFLFGLAYDHSPVPDQSFTMDNPSLSAFNVAVGVRWAFGEHWRATLNYSHYFYLARDIDNSETFPPTNGTGTSMGFFPGFEIECHY